MYDVIRIGPEEAAAFFNKTEREALRTLYSFTVVPQEGTYDVAVREREHIIGAAAVRIASSLAHVEQVVVIPEQRRHGVGRALLHALEELGSYYNCHKMTVEVPHSSDAQRFFEACGYREEAVLPQHTFKLDVAVLRKFLL